MLFHYWALRFQEDLEIVESLFPVMVTDSFETSSAMSYDVISPTDVDASYNPITYKKVTLLFIIICISECTLV